MYHRLLEVTIVLSSFITSITYYFLESSEIVLGNVYGSSLLEVTFKNKNIFVDLFYLCSKEILRQGVLLKFKCCYVHILFFFLIQTPTEPVSVTVYVYHDLFLRRMGWCTYWSGESKKKFLACIIIYYLSLYKQ